MISFTLFVVLAGTGLLDWLVLPRGYNARSGLLVSLRHFCVAVHEWAALAFMIVVVVHILLHWPYVKTHLVKHGPRH